jgi:hypothetical protein
MVIINIKDATRIVNTECLPRGLNCRYLECTPHEPENTLIAYCWRRKLPKQIPSIHVIVDFQR